MASFLRRRLSSGSGSALSGGMPTPRSAKKAATTPVFRNRRRSSSFGSISIGFGSGGKHKSKGHRTLATQLAATEDLECSLRLGENVLKLGRDGKWELDEATVGNYKAEIERLQKYVKVLEQDKEYLLQQYTKTKEEKLMVEFKNKLLVELLAAAQLDVERNHEEFEKESLKSEALTWEISNLMANGTSRSAVP